MLIQPGSTGCEAPTPATASEVPSSATHLSTSHTNSPTQRNTESPTTSGSTSTQSASAPIQKVATTTSQERCEIWLAELDSSLAHQRLEPREKARLLGLKRMLAVGDELCFAVHGLVALWVLDPQGCAQGVDLPRIVVDSACKTLNSVFDELHLFRKEFLIAIALRPNLASDVAKLFQRLASSWNNVLSGHVAKRELPLRHRELLGVLQIRSQNLRALFFQWSLKSLKVYNTPENTKILAALNTKFAEDQDFYLHQNRSEEEYNAHDATISVAFGALLSAATRGQPQTTAASHGSPCKS